MSEEALRLEREFFYRFIQEKGVPQFIPVSVLIACVKINE
jgi:hypothetical protein